MNTSEKTLRASEYRDLARRLWCVRGQRLSILLYHRVLPEPDPMRPTEPHAERFRLHMQNLRRLFTVLPLDTAVERLRAGTLPANAAAITFDDGYRDNFTIAWPILKELGLPMTVFVATGYLDGKPMFNDRIIEAIRQFPDTRLDLTHLDLGQWSVDDIGARRSAVAGLLRRIKYVPPLARNALVHEIERHMNVPLCPDLMMSREQVRSLHGEGAVIGAHTVQHPVLSQISTDESMSEIADSKEVLESVTGSRIRLFAYPNGIPGKDYSATHIEQARMLGFEAAVSTARGVTDRKTDRFQLPRFTPWDTSACRFAVRLALNHLTGDTRH